ncbi:MAG: hypothetical protein AAFR66_05525 [Bacteroidota bacterium]
MRLTRLSPEELKHGYDWAYKSFFSWPNILKASMKHYSHKHKLKHFPYTGGWKKFEPLWNFIIKTGVLNEMLPLLEAILSRVKTERHSPNERDSFSPTLT